MPPHTVKCLRYLPADVDGPPPWDEACREFLDNRALEGYSPRTLEWYTFVLNPFGRYLRETIGSDDPSAAQENDVRAFLRIVGGEGLEGRRPVGAKRLNDYRQGLSSFYAWLQEQGYVEHNPVQRVRKIRPPLKIMRTLTEAQVKALLEKPDRGKFVGARDYLFMLLLLDTGLRLSEALDLQIADMDLDDMTAIVQGKGNKERRVGLSPRLLTQLKPYLRQRRTAMEAIGLPDSAWLFPNNIGGRLVAKTIQQNLKRYGEAAGISGVRISPHTLRHTHALNFVSNGGDSFHLQKVLGHSSLEMSRRYCNLAQADVLERQRELTPLRTMELDITPAKRVPRRAMSSWGKPGQRIRRRGGCND